MNRARRRLAKARRARGKRARAFEALVARCTRGVFASLSRTADPLGDVSVESIIATLDALGLRPPAGRVEVDDVRLDGDTLTMRATFYAPPVWRGPIRLVRLDE